MDKLEMLKLAYDMGTVDMPVLRGRRPGECAAG